MRAPDPDDDAAASKVWAVYVSEAEKYDRSLVESWKSDMEGMLIFAGLFSASLTAFIIESYKTLIPDSGNSTVQLLTQISQQLAAAANGSTFQVPPPTHFSPPPTSLVCNALWFISLGLSLTCALIATLLEQWARDFLHKADMRSAPVIRARVFSFLYYGLKRFNMHTVVDIIPLLLHTSLIFFFAGLVAFLLPVNSVVTYIAVGLLVVVVTAYALLTVLPIWYPDCPYHTPLSNTFWRISQFSLKRWLTWRNPEMWRETVVGAMFRQAMAASPARAARDYRALVWTVKSLADNTELEPFVEGLPDLLWGPENRRYTYEDHIQQLTRTADLGLLSRIEELLRSCHSGLLTAPARTQREIACYKALWAIASIQTSPILPRTPLPLDFWQFARHYNWPSPDLGMHHYSRSAVLLMKRSIFCHLQSLLAVPVSKLSEDVSLGLVPDLKSFVHYVKRQHWYWDVSFPGFMTQRLLQYYNTTADTSNTGDISELVADVVQAFETFSKQTPYKLFFDYCIWAAEQETLPYRFSETEEIILPSDNRPANFAAYAALLEDALANIVYHIPLDSSKWSEPTTQCFDIVIQRFCTLWSPEDSDSLPIPHTLTRYFATRKIHSVIHNCLWSSGIIRPLLHAIPATLSGPLDSRYWRHLDAREDTLTTLWHAAYTARSFFTPHICHSILTALADGPRTPAGFWSTVMMKTVLASFKSVPMPDAQADPTLVETRLTLLAEFLEGWTSDFTPYEPALTMRWIGILAKVAKSQQLRLAASINRALTAHIDNPRSFEVLDALMNSALGVPIFRWLDEPTARNQIKSILSDYLQRLTSTSNLIQHGALLRKLEEVVRLLESSHPPEE